MIATHYTYLLINFFSVLFPFIFSFHPKLKFYLHFEAFIKANIPVAFLFILWDSYFTSIGVWGFNPTYTTGISIGNLPIEEILFFICIPFACLFTIHCFSQFFHLKWIPVFEHFFIIFLSFFLIFIGLFHLDKWYTSSTAISTGLVLLALKYCLKMKELSKFFLVFPVILIPFFIVNGILTGTGLENPIVWYNDNENLGIRMGTIPVEDAFYGMELLLLNYFLYNMKANRIC